MDIKNKVKAFICCFMMLFITSEADANPIYEIKEELLRLNKHQEAKAIKNFIDSYPEAVLFLTNHLPKEISFQTKILLINLILYAQTNIQLFILHKNPSRILTLLDGIENMLKEHKGYSDSEEIFVLLFFYSLDFYCFHKGGIMYEDNGTLRSVVLEFYKQYEPGITDLKGKLPFKIYPPKLKQFASLMQRMDGPELLILLSKNIEHEKRDQQFSELFESLNEMSEDDLSYKRQMAYKDAEKSKKITILTEKDFETSPSISLTDTKDRQAAFLHPKDQRSNPVITAVGSQTMILLP